MRVTRRKYIRNLFEEEKRVVGAPGPPKEKEEEGTERKKKWGMFGRGGPQAWGKASSCCFQNSWGETTLFCKGGTKGERSDLENHGRKTDKNT